jgi:hypothetical protein
MPGARRLVFVYNADSGPITLLVDAAHKALAPKTYPCNLCRLTYGFVRPKPRWRAFVSSLPLPATFLHRDEFRAVAPDRSGDALPAVYVEDDAHGFDLVASAEELNRARDLDGLERLLTSKLRSYGPLLRAEDG